MKLSAREDIAAPIDEVFARVTDVAALERAALRRGFTVTRFDGEGAPGVGANWEVGFGYRGKRRVAQTQITGWNPEHGAVFVIIVDGLRSVGELDLTPLARERTRLHLTLDLHPETFRARLLLQSLKLAKSNLSQRFKSKVSGLARQIEAGRGF